MLARGLLFAKISGFPPRSFLGCAEAKFFIFLSKKG
jgi:hypothetical protein